MIISIQKDENFTVISKMKTRTVCSTSRILHILSELAPSDTLQAWIASVKISVHMNYFRISDHRKVELHSVTLESMKPTHPPKYEDLQSYFTYSS